MPCTSIPYLSIKNFAKDLRKGRVLAVNNLFTKGATHQPKMKQMLFISKLKVS
jgi:hypothetical protein